MKEVKYESNYFKRKIFQEIKLIPEEKLADVYALLHHFRLSLKHHKLN